MKFPPSLLDEIRARLPVSAVVGRRVKLTKAGREFKGLSPFNAEKSPSFFVNDQKGFYHDFSSGKHGDIFTFLMETEGLAFPEAVERLASEAGVAPSGCTEAPHLARRAQGGKPRRCDREGGSAGAARSGTATTGSSGSASSSRSPAPGCSRSPRPG